MPRRYRVLELKRYGEKVARLSVDAEEIALAALPGQFAHIECGGGINSILRRPLSISDAEGSRVKFLFQIKGEGTKWLSERKPGDFLDILAPLGSGCFNLPHSGKALLVAGGIGVAPMLFLARRALEAGLDARMLYGAASAEDLYRDTGELESLRLKTEIATEDGSSGVKGLVTDLLEKYLASGSADVIFACGPIPMLKAVAAIGSRSSVPVQVSLEERMACGLGACRGCVVSVKRDNAVSYQNVCSAGPVFDATEVFFFD